MLARFRKTGGFQQLVTLIETSPPTKQKILLELVAKEDPGWAHLLKDKLLSFERILSWPPTILLEITSLLPDQILIATYLMARAVPASGYLPAQDRWLQGLPHLKARSIQEMSMDFQLTPEEQNAALIRVLLLVRELESRGQIQFSKFDPSLVLDQRLAA